MKKIAYKEARLAKTIPALIFLLFFISVPFFTSPDEPLCKQIANYTMDVKLDTEQKLIKATEFLSWTNDTDISTQVLWFHLYWNAFQNNMSTFLTEGARRGRSVPDFKKDDWGFCSISSIKVIQNPYFDNYDLLPLMEFRQPDDLNILDQTVFSVKLAKPVEPGQTILLNIEFESKIPRPISRTGVYRDNYFIAQWFPKIGVFEDGEWNCHQYHSSSEYYADYGTYDVKITLPSSFIVGATGEHREKIENTDGTTSHYFFQQSVHDFAWTASPSFLEYKEDFEFTPGKTTEITLLLQPYHKHLKKRYMNAVKNAIKYCSLFYGDYPYTTSTCVDPAYNSRSEGMEYPTFFTGGTYFLTWKGMSSPEEVTIHEFGHGYFYGLVGSNEFENPWMDEGFTSFLDTEIYYAAYGDPLYYKTYFGIPVTFKDVKIPIESDGISDHRGTYNMDDMQRFTWKFMEGGSYGANSYSKAELMLRTLKRFMGEELFAKMIKDYSQRHWFKHPRPEDFYAVVSEYAEQDMSWFLDQFVYGSGKLDYAIGSIKSQKERQSRGWFNGEYRERAKNTSNNTLYRSEVTVRRLGEVKIPIDLLIVFEDGREVKETWDGIYRWEKFTYIHTSQIKEAIIDPEFKLVLDLNRTNNSMKRKPNTLAPLKWVSNWMLWLQHALEFFTILGG
jgi:hypothetical protein